MLLVLLVATAEKSYPARRRRKGSSVPGGGQGSMGRAMLNRNSEEQCHVVDTGPRTGSAVALRLSAQVN